MAIYLITGGAGFVGSHLAEFLTGLGHEVRVIDDMSTGQDANLRYCTFVQRDDILSPKALLRAVEGVEGIFHLAAVSSVQAYLEGWANATRINAMGGALVFETAARAGIPVVYASSAAVYGAAETVPLAETAPTVPLSGYGADKLGLELHASTMATMLGLQAIGVRFFNIFGPRQLRGSPYSGVLTIFMDRWLAGEPLTVFGDGQQTRDFIHVRDAARALWLAMEQARDGQRGVYNVCSGRGTTVLQLAQSLSQAVGQPLEIRHADPRPGEIRTSLGDPGLAQRALGFQTSVDIDEGIMETARWARDVAVRSETPKTI